MSKIKSIDAPNILFLDVDGVLNSETWFRSRGSPEDDMTETQFALWHIDPTSVKILDDFVAATKCKVVLSSTWRLGMPCELMTAYLKEKGASFEVTSKTPCLNMNKASVRGNEIAAWLSDYIADDYAFKRYVIFDDDSDMLLNQANNFHKVDSWCGLTPRICWRAQNYLASLK